MIDAFSFMDGERTYACSVEGRRTAGGGVQWWWFGVTGDGHRYAPFQADEDDTEFSVRYRVVAYSDDLIARRGRSFSTYPR